MGGKSLYMEICPEFIVVLFCSDVYRINRGESIIRMKMALDALVIDCSWNSWRPAEYAVETEIPDDLEYFLLSNGHQRTRKPLCIARRFCILPRIWFHVDLVVVIPWGLSNDEEPAKSRMSLSIRQLLEQYNSFGPLALPDCIMRV